MTAPLLRPLETESRAFRLFSLSGEFGRYFAAGLVAFGVDFSVYVALTEWAAWHYLVSATVAFCAGLATVYLFSIRWVFRARRLDRPSRELGIFVAIGVAGLALTATLLFLLTDIAGIDYRLSKVAATGLVFLFNFGFRKFFLFRARRRP